MSAVNLHPRLLRKDWHGYRKDKGHVFTCGCGCGGHVIVTNQQVGVTLVLREREQARTAKKPDAQVMAGDTFYVEGHEPMGVADVRTGQRTQLRATT